MDLKHEIYFVKYPDKVDCKAGIKSNLFVSAHEVCFMGAENLLPGEVPMGLRVVFLTGKLRRGATTPFEEWQLFNFCDELKLYPPKQLQKKVKGNFHDYVESCLRNYPFKLEELFGLTVKSLNKEWWIKRDNLITKELVLLIDLFKVKKFKNPAYEIFLSKVEDAKEGMLDVKLKEDLVFPETYTRYKQIYDKYKQNWINLFLQYPGLKPDFKQVLDTYNSVPLNKFKNSFLVHILPYIKKRNNLFIFGRE